MSAGNPTERPEERDSLPTWDEIDLLVDTDPLALRDLARTLINEVKELREKLAKTQAVAALKRSQVEDMDTRIAQMENALREIANAEGLDPQHRAAELRAVARAALSPSDTEEEA